MEFFYMQLYGTRGGAVGWAPPTSQKVAGSNPDGKIWTFNLHNLSSGIIDLRSTNEYQEYFLGGRADKLTTFNLLKTSRNVIDISSSLCTTICPGVMTEGIDDVWSWDLSNKKMKFYCTGMSDYNKSWVKVMGSNVGSTCISSSSAIVMVVTIKSADRKLQGLKVSVP
jgi:hypothetical protein